MDSALPNSLVEAALAAPLLSWPEIHELFGQQALALRTGPAAAVPKQVFYDIRLDQYNSELLGMYPDPGTQYLTEFIPLWGPTLGSQNWEHILRRQYLHAHKGESPAWNRLKLVYEITVSDAGEHVATVLESELFWDGALAAVTAQQQAYKLQPLAHQPLLANSIGQLWATTQRSYLEYRLTQEFVRQHVVHPPEQGEQQVFFNQSIVYFIGTDDEHEFQQDSLPAGLIWLFWQYWLLRWAATPQWDVLMLTLSVDGQYVFRLGKSGSPLLPYKLGHSALDSNSSHAAATPPTPELRGRLEATFATLSKALLDAREDEDQALLLRWYIGAYSGGSGRSAGIEIDYSTGIEKLYPGEDEELSEEIREQLNRFAEDSVAARAPWVFLFVLLPPGDNQTEYGFFRAEQLPKPFQTADMLPYYALIREGLLPQLPPSWEILTVASGHNDGLIPYEASARLSTGETVWVEVRSSGRAMVALHFLYAYGLHAADCDWQHVELTYRRTGELTAAFYLAYADTDSGLGDEPEEVVEEWLPAIP